MAWAAGKTRPSEAGRYSVDADTRFKARYAGHGKGWVVVNGDGRQVDGPFGTEAEAAFRARAMKAALDARAKRGPRPCICCGVTFDSEGIHNRMCNRCRGRGDALGDPQRPYIGGR